MTDDEPVGVLIDPDLAHRILRLLRHYIESQAHLEFDTTQMRRTANELVDAIYAQERT